MRALYTTGGTMTKAIMLALALVAIAACSSDDVGTRMPTTATAVTCDALVGVPTADVIANAQCATGTGSVELLSFASYNCPDGRTLSWNDFGWGYSDGPWRAHARGDGQLVPPQPDLDACHP